MGFVQHSGPLAPEADGTGLRETGNNFCSFLMRRDELLLSLYTRWLYTERVVGCGCDVASATRSSHVETLSPTIRLVPRTDRRQRQDRRLVWRGGRRSSDAQ